jgi:phosphatidylinositol alpha-1,6-mannosyltransferase
VADAAPILVLVPSLAGADGVSEVSRQFVRALADLRPPVLVYALHDVTAVPMGAGVAVHPSASRRVRFAAALLARAAAPPRPAAAFVLHLHLAPLALPLIGRGVPVSVVLHGVEAWTRLPLARRGTLSRVHELIAVSRHSASRAVAANPELASRRLRVCHPACPPGALPGPEMVSPGFALIVGRMAAAERYKGHDLLIDAWPRLLAQRPDSRLVMAGDGDDAARLRRRVADAGLGEAIVFTGAVTPSQLASLYRDASCLVMPSTGEGFGLVYLEAMRAGLPCVASPGAAEEIVMAGESGLIVPAEAGAVADALAPLLGDPDRRRRMGEAGQARVEAVFTYPRLVARLSAALEGTTAAAC